MKKKLLSFKNIILFLYYWLCVGFFLGTLILMGPVRWLTNYTRANEWAEWKEKMLVILMIVILIIISFILARILTIKAIASNKRPIKIGMIIGALFLFIISLWFWMHPKMMIDSNMKESTENISGIEFVFGPYPEKEKLIKLQKEKYTAVISLLSMAVVPFEPVLIKQEENAAKEVGIKLIHIAMLPWISENDEVEDKIEEIIKQGNGKYYVHCYLGKDRVNVFKKIVSSISKEVKINMLEPNSMRSLSDIKRFERGDISLLDSNVYFIPYPTDEEFFGYILNGSIKTIVSLLNSNNEEDKPWMDKENKMAKKYNVKLVNYPWVTLNKTKRIEAMKEIIKMEKPIAIHAFNTTAPECVNFIETYHQQNNK